MPEPATGFDRYAQVYDEALERGLSLSGENRDYYAHGRIAWLKRCLARLAEPQPRRILDFGCGTGLSAPLLAAAFDAEFVMGVDVSPESIAIARRQHASARIHFATVDEFVPDGQFDLAFCNGVFHHIPRAEQPSAIDLVRRALRPDGIVALWENNPWNPGTRLVMRRIPFDRDAIMLWPRRSRTLLREGQFQVIGTSFAFVFPRLLAWARGAEPLLSRMPLGAQYQVLARRTHA